MTIVRYPVKEAAKLAANSYNPKADRTLKNMIADECPIPGAEAYLLTNGFLLIPGTNSLMDHIRFNFRPFRIGNKRYTLKEPTTQKGASHTIWHQGFMAHAQAIYDWMGNRRPTLIIGHSLGAASTQILSKSYARTGICFAAPRPRRTRGRIPNDKYCLSVCRVDDPVCAVVGHFFHMGRAPQLRHKRPRFGLNHNMHAYLDALNNNIGDKVPHKWP